MSWLSSRRLAPFRSQIDYSARPIERTSVPGCIRQATGSRALAGRRIKQKPRSARAPRRATASVPEQPFCYARRYGRDGPRSTQNGPTPAKESKKSRSAPEGLEVRCSIQLSYRRRTKTPSGSSVARAPDLDSTAAVRRWAVVRRTRRRPNPAHLRGSRR